MLVTRPCDVARHLNAPLLAERESYLQYLASQGRSRNSQRDAGGYLLQVVGHLKLTRLRAFRTEELRVAAHVWSHRNGLFKPKTNCGRRAFMCYARGWLRFHGKLIEPKKWNEPRDKRVELYKRYLRTELGFAIRTVDSRVWGLNRFLLWLAESGLELTQVTVAHVERYLDYLEAQGWKPRSVACAAEHLKVFFRFAERKRWGCRGVSGGVFGPRNPTIVHTSSIERGPQWRDVHRLIEFANGENDNDYRARAVLTLLHPMR